jgi:hypothetical protein
MNGLTEAAAEVCGFMSDRQWEFCIIGGLAVQQWGEPRTTLDIDLTLLTGWGNEAHYIDALLIAYESRLADARDFAIARRILLLKSKNGKDIDVALGALPFEADMVRRAVHREFAPGIALPCCTPEDLFVMKAFADRPRDWLDAESVAQRQPLLDTQRILLQLEELCALKDSPEILARARLMLAEAS